MLKENTNHQSGISLEKNCDRCGREVLGSDKLYPMSWHDEDEGTDTTYMICWDCDWEIMNGQGELEDDSGVIMACRIENNYEYDPINEVRPY